MPGDLNQMAIFAAVVREGGFTAAARTLGQPKSTVSKRVAELESRLGARLLHRTTRRLAVTAEGAAYYERCRRLVADADEADRLIVAHDVSPRGLIRVTAPSSLAGVLGAIAERFLHDHPKAALELALIDRQVDLVAEGFDLALRAGPLRDSSLVARRLGVTRTCLCASPAYLEENPAPRRPADLRRHQCIVVRSSSAPVVWAFERRKRRATVTVGGRYAVSMMALAHQGALAGLGIARLPRFLAEDDLRAGRLREVLTEWPLRAGEVHLLFAPGQRASPAVRVLADLLARAFAERAARHRR